MSDGNRIFASVTYNGGVKYEGNIYLNGEKPLSGDQVGGTKVEDLENEVQTLNKRIATSALQSSTAKGDDISAYKVLIVTLKNALKLKKTELSNAIEEARKTPLASEAPNSQVPNPQADTQTTSPSDVNEELDKTIVNDPVTSVTPGTTNEDQQLLTNDTNNKPAVVATPEQVSTPAATVIKPPAKNITLNATYDGNTYSGTLIHETTLKERASNLTQRANASAKNIYANTTGALSSAASSAKGALVNAKDAAVNTTKKVRNALTIRPNQGEEGQAGGKTRNKRRRPRRRVTYKYKSKPKPKPK